MPEFQANPEKYYPTRVFESLGFSRAQCPSSGKFYWRHSEARKTCGDSNCEGKYSFIGNGTGKGNNITFAEAWQGKQSIAASSFSVQNWRQIYPIKFFVNLI